MVPHLMAGLAGSLADLTPSTGSTARKDPAGSRDLWGGKVEPVKGAWPVTIGKSVSLLVASKR